MGPTPDKSLFGSMWWFDNAENLAHFVLGVAGIAAVYVLSAQMQKYLVLLLGVLAAVVALMNLGGNTMLLGANLESPADLALHTVVAVWAFWSALRS